jgi:uncharacterized membrane protein YbhN (UPF0104 family)
LRTGCLGRAAIAAGVTDPAAPVAVEIRPKLRDCSENIRELRASQRTLRGVHRFDRLLHGFWSRLPLRLFRMLATAALVAAGIYLVLTRRGPIEHSLADFGRARPGYVLLAVAAELASLVCYAALVGLLLRRGTAVVPFRALFSLTVIGIAMLNSVPGGQALSTIYWYQQLRRYSVQRSVAAFALLVSTVVGIVTLVLLAASGLAVGGHGFGASARTPVLAAAAGIVIVAVVARRQLVPAALALVRRLSGPDSAPAGRTGADHLLGILTLGLLNWLFDVAVLFATLAALGESLPFRTVVVAYALGQLVSAIPILPGGGGTVEATIAAGLIVAGGATTAVVAAVVLYRIISAWGLVPLGWALWLTMPNAHHEQLAPVTA